MRTFLASVTVVALIAVNAFSADWSNAEGSCFSKGVKTLSVGASLGDWGVNAAFDMGFHDAISGGAAVGYNAYIYGSGWVHHNIPVLVRVGFHPFNLAVLADKVKIRDKLDVFIGPSLGWKFGGWSKPTGTNLNTPNYFGLIAREWVGVRYHFAPNIFVFAEDCAGLGWADAGIGFKF